MTDRPRLPEHEHKPPLSLEEFTIRRFNNFYLHFIECNGNIYRAGEHDQRLQKLHEENPELERMLTEALTHANNERYNNYELRTETCLRLKEQLYQAYLIMRKYTDDDNDIFG